jgi:hypothetical protein
LTGLGSHDAERRCTESANKAFPEAVTTTWSSMPAVLRPAFVGGLTT